MSDNNTRGSLTVRVRVICSKRSRSWRWTMVKFPAVDMGFAERWSEDATNRDTMNFLGHQYMTSVNATEFYVEYEFAPFHHFL